MRSFGTLSSYRITFKGVATRAGLLFLAAVLAQVLSLLIGCENKRRDAVHGEVDGTKVMDDVIDSGDGHPNFRFIL